MGNMNPVHSSDTGLCKLEILVLVNQEIVRAGSRMHILVNQEIVSRLSHAHTGKSGDTARADFLLHVCTKMKWPTEEKDQKTPGFAFRNLVVLGP